ncbi:Protein kinase-like domain protein [Cordyceps fumosorosea ARSEF 2679]|uniref:Protein kinase-like domain protein n=1 Tax=Cordyceps fumosorosea (strain ARSEF 2679) TaxID=1081104 RepID=A0A167QMY9_CORFA|nr:Protein kinase-like domain protein [Cordyceps fumosorosea ARSEF 2679]OAA57788.1 Protein kinase-like domain protein [Cordyceps fumosorosea ARSEF 2679]
MSPPNPYEADPQKIPPSDPYREEPLYGRYLPEPTDFTPDSQHINSTTPDSLAASKRQARNVLKALSTINASDCGGRPGYVVADPDPVANRGVLQLEREILSGGDDDVPQSSCVLMHNDLSQSNLIVDRGRILAVVDWEMAGWFSWEKAREVHRRSRSPSEKSYAHLNLPQEVLDDIYFWNDLYG